MNIDQAKGLTFRSRRLLKSVGVSDLNQLCAVSELKILMMTGAGAKTLLNIKEVMERHGLKLGMEGSVNSRLAWWRSPPMPWIPWSDAPSYDDFKFDEEGLYAPTKFEILPAPLVPVLTITVKTLPRERVRPEQLA